MKWIKINESSTQQNTNDSELREMGSNMKSQCSSLRSLLWGGFLKPEDVCNDHITRGEPADREYVYTSEHDGILFSAVLSRYDGVYDMKFIDLDDTESTSNQRLISFFTANYKMYYEFENGADNEFMENVKKNIKKFESDIENEIKHFKPIVKAKELEYEQGKVKEARRIGRYFEYMFFSNAYCDYRTVSGYKGMFSKREVDKMIKSAKNFGFLPSSWKDKADDWIVINIANHSPCGIYNDWSNGASSYDEKAYSPSLNRWRDITMGEYYSSRHAL